MIGANIKGKGVRRRLASDGGKKLVDVSLEEVREARRGAVR